MSDRGFAQSIGRTLSPAGRRGRLAVFCYHQVLESPDEYRKGEPTAEEFERWHDISRQALVLLREKQVYSEEMLGALERHLENFRSRSRESGGE